MALSLGIYMLSIVLVAIRGHKKFLSFFTISNFLFIALVLPKILMFTAVGNDVFLSATAASSPNAVIATSYVIFVFIISINLGYIVKRPKWQTEIHALNSANWQGDYIKTTVTLIVLPMSVLVFLIYFWSAQISFSQIVNKIDFSSFDNGLAVYLSHKLAQFSKVGIYLVLLGVIVGDGKLKGYRLNLLCLLLLLSLVFFTSSQRGGIFLTALLIILWLQYLNVLKLWHIITLGSIFFVLNLLILSSRFENGISGLGFFEIYTRRYFFDVEKLAAIFEFSASDLGYLFRPSVGLFQLSAADWPTYSIHHYVGYEVFGMTTNAIPPSILGEIILYFGALFVLPIGFLLSLLMVTLENRIERSKKPLEILILLILLSNAYFLLLNSDVLSLVKRLLLDGAFVVVTFVFYNIAVNLRTRLQSARTFQY